MRCKAVMMFLSLVAATAPAQVVVDSSGRTISVPPEISKTVPTTIEIVGDAEQVEVRYQLSETPPDQVPLFDSKSAPARKSSNRYEIPVGDPNKPFVLFNVWKTSGLAGVDLDKAKQEIADLKQKLEYAKKDPMYLEFLALDKPGDQPPSDDEKAKARLEAEIQVLEKEELVYGKFMNKAAVDPLIKVEAELRAFRRQLADIEIRLAETERVNRLRKEELAKSDVVKTVAKLLDEVTKKSAALSDVHIDAMKLGVFVRGTHRKQSVFSFPPFEEGKLVRLKLISDMPVLSEDDALYVILANRQARRHPGSYTFTVTSSEGKAISDAKVRIPSDKSEGEREATSPQNEPPEPEKPVARINDDTYDDVMFTAGKRFNGNEIPKITISTTMKVVTEDKETVTDGKPATSKITELQDVDLLKDFQLPQVHPLYRFNIATGVALSGVEDQRFVKVQTQLDDPATTENEARYRIDTSKEGREMRPLMAVTWYWKPIDPLLPLKKSDRATPQPTLAFGVSEPLKNVFIGFSNEIFRSVQLIWGYHRGSITELQPRTDVAEDTQSALPPTRSKPDGAVFVGITLNLNSLGKILGLGS